MAAAKFLRWGLGLFFALGMIYGFGEVTLMMAKAAAHAQQHDQISYGKFTRMLWSQPQRGHHQKAQ